MSESELRPMWLKYSALCRKQGKLSMSYQVLQSLLGLKLLFLKFFCFLL